MLKNLLLLGLLTWVSLSYAGKDVTVARDSISEAESYKIEKPLHEQEAQRSVAGSKTKKKARAEHREAPEKTSETDSEVRYWQYSE